jgi:hypothetical protein
MSVLRAIYRAARQAGIPDEITHGYLRFGPEGMTPAARQTRAAEMGMEPFFRGMGDPHERSRTVGWASSRPDVASTYAVDEFGGMDGANVMPLMVRTDDLPTVEGAGRMFDQIAPEGVPASLRPHLPTDFAATPDDYAAAAYDAGFPGVRIRNVIDDNTRRGERLPPSDTVMRYPQPGQVESGYRSVYAAFDPARRRWANLLAGTSVAAPTGLGLLALLRQREQDI